MSATAPPWRVARTGSFGEQLVSDAPNRVEVGPRADVTIFDLLGSHVRRRADRRPHGRQVRIAVGLADIHADGLDDRLGEAKIGDLDVPIEGDHQVLWLDVAMDDLVLLEAHQPGEQSVKDPHNLRERQLTDVST